MEKIDNRPADTEEVSTILEEFLVGAIFIEISIQLKRVLLMFSVDNNDVR
jgi:hypothetical protein